MYLYTLLGSFTYIRIKSEKEKKEQTVGEAAAAGGKEPKLILLLLSVCTQNLEGKKEGLNRPNVNLSLIFISNVYLPSFHANGPTTYVFLSYLCTYSSSKLFSCLVLFSPPQT